MQLACQSVSRSPLSYLTNASVVEDPLGPPKGGAGKALLQDFVTAVFFSP